MIEENRKMKLFIEKILKTEATINGYKFNRFGINFSFECFITANKNKVILKITEVENRVELSINGLGIEVSSILLENYKEILEEDNLLTENPNIFKMLNNNTAAEDLFNTEESIILTMILKNTELYFDIKYNCFVNELRAEKQINFSKEEFVDLYELIGDKFIKINNIEKDYLIKILSDYKEDSDFEDLKNLIKINYEI